MSIFVLLRRAVAAHVSLVFSFAALVVVAGEARAIPSTVIPNESIFIFDGTTLSGPPPHLSLGTYSDSVIAPLPHQVFSNDSVRASISIDVEADGNFHGLGTASVGSATQRDNVSATSRFAILFVLSQSQAYTGSGLVAAGFGGASDFQLTGPGNTVIFDYRAFDDVNNYVPQTTFDLAGVLAPGTYTLRGITQQSDIVAQDVPIGGFSTYQFQFHLTDVTVPEPATFVLFGIALAGLPFSRRKPIR